MSEYTPSTDDVRFEYAMHKSVVNSRISESGQGTKLGIHFDEFDRWLRVVKAEAWNEALTHVERLSDPASTINITPDRELITLADVTQAREENPYTKENNK